jgi:putative acetyltransferase
MTQQTDQEITVREFQSGDEAAFRAINTAWVTRYFVLEPKDEETFADPQGKILAKGGKIFLATLGGRPVGCCALIPMGPGEYEVAKMGVLEDQQGRGTGRKVLQATVDWARENGAHRLYLETNHQLLPAIHLYHSLGFRDLAPEQITPSPYARADVYMEMVFPANEQSPRLPAETSASDRPDVSTDRQQPEMTRHSSSTASSLCCS